MNDLADILTSVSSTTSIIPLIHDATARVRDGQVLDYAMRGVFRETERVAYKCAEILHRDKRARNIYRDELVRHALSTTDEIPASCADDIRLVREALASDRARRAEIEQAVEELRARLASGLVVIPAPSLTSMLLAS